MNVKRLSDSDIDAIARAILAREESCSAASGSGDQNDARSVTIIANWKMNLDQDEALSFLTALAGTTFNPQKRVVVCPPSVYLQHSASTLPKPIALGCQNVHYESKGAYTGELSCSMLKSLGVSYVLAGHSERRTYFGETSEIIAKKVKAILNYDMTPVICFGETLNQRQADYLTFLENQVLDVLLTLDEKSVERCVLAYEPVWAIGTGETASPEQAQEVHAHVRRVLEKWSQDVAKRVPILYGGSVNKKNYASLLEMPDIDGALVGGASLDLDAFHAICS